MRRRLPACGRRHVAAPAVCVGTCVLFFVALSASQPASPAVRVEADPAPPTIEAFQRLFENPPSSAAPMMRWWWFGPSVTKQELEREMRAMKAGGIGGFEIQPVYPLALDDDGRGIRTLPFLSDEFIDMLRFVGDRSRELGLRMDLTLGSGWPFGGPGVAVASASSKLRVERHELPPGDRAIPPPDLGSGEQLIAVFLEEPGAPAVRRIRLPLPAGGVVSLPTESAGSGRLLFFISSRTGMQVKRAAIGAEGFVLDHYDSPALDGYLSTVGDRLMTAFRGQPPFAVFCDSLEAYEGDWTKDLPGEFRARRGYDLTDHLVSLVEGGTPEADDVRHDWGRTLSELVNERFFAPLREWAARAGTRLRAQAYGIPPATLSSNALVDLPEGEGTQWTRLTATRWASSAAHLYGRAIASAETWTWLHSPAFRAGPLDLKAEADRHFLQGINQIVGHGWPYLAARRRVPRVALLRGRRLQRPEPLVDRDAGRHAIPPARQLRAPPGGTSGRCRRVPADERRVGGFLAGAREPVRGACRPRGSRSPRNDHPGRPGIRRRGRRVPHRIRAGRGPRPADRIDDLPRRGASGCRAHPARDAADPGDLRSVRRDRRRDTAAARTRAGSAGHTGRPRRHTRGRLPALSAVRRARSARGR